MINEILNMSFTIEQVALVSGAALIIGVLFGMVLMVGMILMACLAINDNDD